MTLGGVGLRAYLTFDPTLCTTKLWVNSMEKIIKMTANFLGFMMGNWNTVAIATVVLAFLTALLAYFTWILAREAKKTREQQLEPNIVVTIEPHHRVMFYAILVIENVGKGIAYDVKIKEKDDQTFQHNEKKFKINELRFMSPNILKSGQRIEHLVSRFEELPSEVFEFEVNAKDANGKLISVSNMIDVTCYFDRSTFHDKGMEDFVRLFEKFERNFSNVTSGFNRLKVDVFDREERSDEQKQLEERFKENKKTRKR